MKPTSRAECPFCLTILRVRVDGRLPIHGPKRQRCTGAEEPTGSWGRDAEGVRQCPDRIMARLIDEKLHT